MSIISSNFPTEGVNDMICMVDDNEMDSMTFQNIGAVLIN